jgi:hypothetical protein
MVTSGVSSCAEIGPAEFAIVTVCDCDGCKFTADDEASSAAGEVEGDGEGATVALGEGAGVTSVGGGGGGVT